MFNKSLWNAYSYATNFPELQQNINTETLIIGGGMTGISLSMKLSEFKHQHILIEGQRIGGGTSSHSTGNLYTPVDSILSKLNDKYDLETVKSVLLARQSAMDTINQTVKKWNLDCDFQNVPWYLYAFQEDKDKIETEREVGQQLGLELKISKFPTFPYPAASVIALENQAQFNPMKYVQALSKCIDPDYGLIFENTMAVKIEHTHDGYEVTTAGGVIRAKNLVHATHVPKGFSFLQTLLGPYREYGIACKLQQRIDMKGIYWGFHQENKYSSRTAEQDGEQFLIIVGQPHKVGQGKDNRENIAELKKFAFQYFDVKEITYKWGGQHYRPADLLPFIGKAEENMYVGTGYSTDGLVYGSLAANIIADQITGKVNPWTELFDPARVNPLKSASNFIKENLNMARQYLSLIPGMADKMDFAEIKKGQGKVIEKDGHKLAVYRNADKKLIIKSAICTHLGCVVHFNEAEETWDCPCHGSRFNTEGFVIEGPALKPLHDITGKEGKVIIEKE